MDGSFSSLFLQLEAEATHRVITIANRVSSCHPPGTVVLVLRPLPQVALRTQPDVSPRVVVCILPAPALCPTPLINEVTEAESQCSGMNGLHTYNLSVCRCCAFVLKLLPLIQFR